MIQNPLVSTIIPFFNREEYLAEAIESVLSQTYSTIEIIIVDDGSTDSSAQIAKRYSSPSIHYVYQENKGIGAARNKGIELAQGDYFAFLDSDDLWMEYKTSLQVGIFQSRPNINMVFGHIKQFYSPEKSKTTTTNESQKDLVSPGYVSTTMLIEREAFFKVGFFSTEWRIGEFIDWYARAQEKGLRAYMLTEVLTKRRIHKANIGITDHQSQKDYASILKTALDRRRKNS